jgi:hypothetical protein
MTITTEVYRRIWDDAEGACIEIRPDQDGLGCVEIWTPNEKSVEYYGKLRVSFSKEMARQIGEAMIAASQEEF